MYDYSIRAAFAAAQADNYQPIVGLDPDMLAEQANALIEHLDGLDFTTEDEEERRVLILGEAFARTFEAGLKVGLEAGEEGIELRIHLDRETVTGLVQRALAGEQNLKE